MVIYPHIGGLQTPPFAVLAHLRHLAARPLVAALAVALALIAMGCSSPETPEPVVIERVVEVTREVTPSPEEAVPQMAAIGEVPEEVATEEPATPVPSLIEFRGPTIGTGGNHTCALRTNGTIECWGRDRDGQASPPAGSFTSISAGGFHTCALRDDGTALCWGNNNVGQSNSGARRFAAISAGAFHTCGLRESGEVECWGSNNEGQLYASDGHFVAISAGYSHTCALREDGDAECWGHNEFGQATDVPGEGFVAIDLSYTQTCALRADGMGLCWGGLGSTKEDVSVVVLDGPFTAIGVGGSDYGYACALLVDSASVCWGNNRFGQAAPPEGIHFTAMSVGYAHACALRESGEAVCWGRNRDGESTPPPGRFAQSRTALITLVPSAKSSFDAASILARFSTDDPEEGEERAKASGEIVAQYNSGNADTGRVVDLLHTLSPELSLDERRRAAEELTRLSGDDAEVAAAVNHLAALITGHEVNAEGRIAAASEMVALYRAGDLNTDAALGLMDTIAPGLSVLERAKAAELLAKFSVTDDWDDADSMEAANEVFRLATGVPLEAEKRLGAAVDLAGMGVKIFDTEGQFDDRDIDIATELIKQSLTGELTTESVKSLLELD